MPSDGGRRRKRSRDACPLPCTDTRDGLQDGGKRVYGPTLPTEADLLLRREELESDARREAEQRQTERHAQQKRHRKEERARIEEVAPKGDAGRERRVQQKKDKKEQMRGFRERSAEVQLEESELYGDGGDTFQSKKGRQEAVQQQKRDKQLDFLLEKDAALRERRQAAQSKEQRTMEMLRRLAQERYGRR